MTKNIKIPANMTIARKLAVPILAIALSFALSACASHKEDFPTLNYRDFEPQSGNEATDSDTQKTPAINASAQLDEKLAEILKDSDKNIAAYNKALEKSAATIAAAQKSGSAEFTNNMATQAEYSAFLVTAQPLMVTRANLDELYILWLEREVSGEIMPGGTEIINQHRVRYDQLLIARHGLSQNMTGAE